MTKRIEGRVKPPNTEEVFDSTGRKFFRRVLNKEQLQLESKLRSEGERIRLIPLTDGKVCKIDEEDYEWVKQFSWRLCRGYASRDPGKRRGIRYIALHREIMKTPTGMYTDHINRDPLDNRKSNLRICTQSENQANRTVSRNNKLGIKGVIFSKNRFVASVKFQGKRKSLGSFKTVEEATLAYNEGAKKLHGEFVPLSDQTRIIREALKPMEEK